MPKVSELSPLSSRQRAWWHAGRTRAVAGSCDLIRRLRETLGLVWTFEISEPFPHDTLLPTRPFLLNSSNPFKQCYSLGTKHLYLSLYGLHGLLKLSSPLSFLGCIGHGVSSQQEKSNKDRKAEAEDHYKFKASLDYIENSGTAWVTISKTEQKTNKETKQRFGGVLI